MKKKNKEEKTKNDVLWGTFSLSNLKFKKEIFFYNFALKYFMVITSTKNRSQKIIEHNSELYNSRSIRNVLLNRKSHLYRHEISAINYFSSHLRTNHVAKY